MSVVADGHSTTKVRFRVESNEVTQLTVSLFESATLSGRVVDGNGATLHGVEFVIEYAPFPRDPRIKYSLQANWHRGVLTTNERGDFRVSGITGDVAFSLKLKHPVLGDKDIGTYSIPPGEEFSGLTLAW